MVFPSKARFLIPIAICLLAVQSVSGGPAERLSAARALCEGAERSNLKMTDEVKTALRPGSDACRTIAAGETPTGKVQSWVESSPRKTLSFDGLMGSSAKQESRAELPAPTPAPTLAPRPVAASGSDPRGQLQLDFRNINSQRQAIKVHDARGRIDGLGLQMQGICSCLDAGSCFDAPQFAHQSMNEAMDSDMAQHDLQLQTMCDDWNEFEGEQLPADAEALAGIADQLQAYLDNEANMQAALRQRTSEFRSEERRVARAQAAAQAQTQKKGNGFFAALTTMAAGAVLSDKLGFELDPDALAKTSISVGRAVENGGGVGAAFGEGVTGLSQMVRSATPIVPPSSNGGGNYLKDAMAHVKKFPAPSAAGSQPAGGLSTMSAATAQPMAFAGMTQPTPTGRMRPPALPEGIPDASVAEANRYMQAGHDLVLNQQTTPGGGNPDAFGVPEPTVEKISYVCRVKSNVPLADGNGGVKHYYENEIEMDIRYWIPECGEAKKAHYIAYGCNRIDDLSAVDARCQQACGSPDCRSTKYEQQLMNGLAR